MCLSLSYFEYSAALRVSVKLAMVTACTQVLSFNTCFRVSTRAWAVTNLCFTDTL